MQRLGSFPLVRAPEAARRPLQQARPNHVCAAWSPRAGAGAGGGQRRRRRRRERSPGGACTLPGRRVHADTPAPRQLGSGGWRSSAPPVTPAPRPCDSSDSSGGGGEGLLICSGGEERGPAESETHRDGQTLPYPEGRRTHGRIRPRGEKGREPQRGRGSQKQGEGGKEGEPSATWGKEKQQRLRIRSTEAHSREEDSEEKKRNRHTHGRKQTTADVVEVSINIC